MATATELDVSKRKDVSVKMDPEAVRIARNVATYHGKSLAEYLSEVVMAAAEAGWQEILNQEQKPLPKSAPKKKGGEK